ncbi:hypothetical protein Acr_00g0032760 [Actinidia rufa]|uniref:Uncharacterized protein n=1 Tax=Actinidia rufa TaxID=165716 RepID=A0A7J0DFH7_9ERIC|nr:hypothetical protein Acr_00g0032760 [Actinidia rufa]
MWGCCCMKRGEKIENRHPRRFYGCVGSSNLLGAREQFFTYLHENNNVFLIPCSACGSTLVASVNGVVDRAMPLRRSWWLIVNCRCLHLSMWTVRSYCLELVKQRRLWGNDGLSLEGHSSVVATAPSSNTKGIRARSIATVGRDLFPTRPMSNCVFAPSPRVGDHRARSVAATRRGFLSS